jgi:ureidoacrylate peracid hydrolase
MNHSISMLKIDARPQSVMFDPTRCCVLVVDMQNDFGSKGGMFDHAGIDITLIREIIAPTVKVLAAARSKLIPVVYLAMQHRPDLTDMGALDAPHRIKHAFLKVGSSVPSPNGEPSRILVTGGWGTRIIPELEPQLGDIVVPKHRYSGFFETQLDSILRGKNVKHIVVVGATTSVCVESTIRDAMFRDYQCILLEDCCAEPIGSGNERGNHEASLLTVELLFGWISSSEKFISALNTESSIS